MLNNIDVFVYSRVTMPFHYRLQKILDFRIKKKEEQLQVVLLAQQEVYRIEALIDANNRDIASTRANMRKADFMMMEAYDNYLKHLYEKGEDLELEKQKAIENLEIEKEKLIECEKAVKVLEKHRERALEIYKEEEKNIELKRLSEVAVQKHFAKTRELNEEELLEELRLIEGENFNES